MLHQILLEQGISERLLSQATGERDLTVSYIWQKFYNKLPRYTKVKRHCSVGLKKKIQGEGRQEAQIRLESERQLVKIVSIHKSKA